MYASIYASNALYSKCPFTLSLSFQDPDGEMFEQDLNRRNFLRLDLKLMICN